MTNKNILIQQISYIKYDKQKLEQDIKKNNGMFIVQGILQKADTPNQNKRVYPKAILEKQVQRYKRQKIANNQATGQLDHPESTSVSLKYVSHNILDLWWQGSTLMGKIQILDTPNGLILKQLFKSGIRVGISSRGVGSVSKKDGLDYVDQDFQIVCWDFVSTPSTPGAYTHKINQSKQYNLIQSKKKQKINNINYLINQILNNIS